MEENNARGRGVIRLVTI